MGDIKKESLTEFEKKIVQKIEKLILEKQSVRKFADKVGIGYQNLHNILNLKQHMNLKHLGKIIDGLGGNFIQFFTDKEYVPADSIPVIQDKDSKEYIAVPQVSPVTCGTSGAIPDNKIHGYKYFSVNFLHNFQDPLLTVAQGDSMEPVLTDGDLILVDRNKTNRLNPNSRDFYLVNIPETSEEIAITVKRIKLTKKTLIIVPQNSKYEIQEIDLTGRTLLDIIYGRVVWVGRQLVEADTKYSAINILREFRKRITKKK